jgi:hypothetical protein
MNKIPTFFVIVNFTVVALVAIPAGITFVYQVSLYLSR